MTDEAVVSRSATGLREIATQVGLLTLLWRKWEDGSWGSYPVASQKIFPRSVDFACQPFNLSNAIPIAVPSLEVFVPWDEGTNIQHR